MFNGTAAEWHAYIRSAASFAAAQACMEEALRAGVDFSALRREQEQERDAKADS